MSRLYGGTFSDIGKARNKRAHRWIKAYVKSWTGEAHIHMEDEDTVRFRSTNLNVIIDNQKMFRKQELGLPDIKAELTKCIRAKLKKHQRFPFKEYNALFDLVDAMSLLRKVENEKE